MWLQLWKPKVLTLNRMTRPWRYQRPYAHWQGQPRLTTGSLARAQSQQFCTLASKVCLYSILRINRMADDEVKNLVTQGTQSTLAAAHNQAPNNKPPDSVWRCPRRN